MTFEWFFTEQDLEKATASTVEDDIFGTVYTVNGKEKYITDIHKEYYNSGDNRFDLEVYVEHDDGSHGKWLGSIKDIKTSKSLKRFKNRAEKLLDSFIAEFDSAV